MSEIQFLEKIIKEYLNYDSILDFFECLDLDWNNQFNDLEIVKRKLKEFYLLNNSKNEK